MGVFTTAALPSWALDFGQYGELGNGAGCRLDDWYNLGLSLRLILGGLDVCGGNDWNEFCESLMVLPSASCRARTHLKPK